MLRALGRACWMAVVCASCLVVFKLHSLVCAWMLDRYEVPSLGLLTDSSMEPPRINYH